MKEDLQIYIHENYSKESNQNITSFDPKIDSGLFSIETQKKNSREFLDGVEVDRKPMDKIRKLTAEHMIRSVRVSPHVSMTFEAILDKVCQHKQKIEKKFLQDNFCKLTYTAYFIAACVNALKKHPVVNSSVDKTDILFKKKN